MTQTDMIHPADETLLALLHEQPVENAAATRSHVIACDDCASRWRQLSADDDAVAGLLGVLDHPAPAVRARSTLSLRQRHRHRLRRALLIAGSAATLAVAAAAMVVPVSPLHQWIRDAVTGRVVPSDAPRPLSPPPAAPAALASGIAIPATRKLLVIFRREPTSGVVEIARSDTGDVTFRSRGGTTAYAVTSNHVSIDNQAPAVAYFIGIPPAVQQVRILVGSRVLLRWPEDSARVALPEQSVRARIVLAAPRENVP